MIVTRFLSTRIHRENMTMKYLRVIFFFVCGILPAQTVKDFHATLISRSSIFPDGTFEACHASTIVETTPGNFLAAWFAGSYEGSNDVGIWISTSENEKWNEPREIVVGKDPSGKQLPCWNPVLFKTRNNKLILFYKVGPNPREWWGSFIQSTDYGKTWSNPKNLPQGFLGPIKNKPIELENGKILCPSSIETTNGEWGVNIEITNEELTSWQKIEVEADSGVGVIQPALLIHSKGRLQMLCRSRQNLVYQSWSEDNGLQWSKLEPTNVPNPNSGIDAETLDNGSFVLIYNPLQSGKEWWLGRNILNVAISEDGINWKDIYQLENEEEGEFSYPAIIQAKDKSLHITYTGKRKAITHTILKINSNKP
jgi:alpha-L-fucosidase